MTTQDRWVYQGDVSLEYGGTFIDLSTFADGYCDAVVVTDIDSGCGFRGASMIEHVVICGTDDSKRIREAIDSCGWIDDDNEQFRQLLAFLGAIEEAGRGDSGPSQMFKDWLQEGDRTSLLHMVAEALCSYGHRDPDDAWNNYRSSHTEVVQTDPNGPMDFDGWRADKRLRGTTLEAYVRSVHLRD